MRFLQIPPIDIIGFLRALIALTVIALIMFVVSGITQIRAAKEIRYYRIRKQRTKAGWKFILFGFVIALIALVLIAYGEPIAYSVYEVTMTPSLTPTITPSPTITPTPTLTLTPTITNTPDKTYTPTPTATLFIPDYILEQFHSEVTPPAKAVFSELIFSKGFDKEYNAINPNVSFNNPVGHLYALFSYNNLVPGVQWTAIWYRNGEIVHYESLAWDGGGGGFGYTDWAPEPDKWVAGTYFVQIYIGEIEKTAGSFTVEGIPPTLTPTHTPTPTP